MNNRILLVDDDKDLSMVACDMLESYNYAVKLCGSASEAYDILVNEVFDLIILDINLPDETGFEVCKELRLTTQVPIIFASARTSEDDRIVGLDIGADDYIPKPYSLKELLSRINALMRRTYGFNKEEAKVLAAGDIYLNPTSRVVTLRGKEVSLSLKEYDLLAYLMKNQGVALKKETILTQVWGTYSDVELNSVAVHIRWLRQKLEKDANNPEHIKTVWGVGYMLV